MVILRKFRTNVHSLKEIMLLFHILILSSIIPVLAKHFTVPQLLGFFTPKKISRLKGNDERKIKIIKYTDYILNIKPELWNGTCLKRSLILFYFLRKLGMNISICFGTRYNIILPEDSSGKNLEGHAWLMHNGKIFLEKNVELTKTFTMTYVFPNGRS